MKITLSFALLSALVPVAVVADRGEPRPTKPLGRCDFSIDCDEDHQCMKGLICADRHKKQLKAAGYDNRLADCGPSTNPSKPLYEVCFDPKLIYNSGGFGDPHFQTFDGTDYSFHGECDLVMARSPFFANGTGIEIHARTTMVGSWSLISSTAMRIGNDVLEIVNDDTVYVNGVKTTELPIKLAGEYEVSKTEEVFAENESSRTVYTVALSTGEIKVSNNQNMLRVDVNAYLPGTEGMLGTQSTTGMVGRDRHTIYTDANEMGAQWQVRDYEVKLFRENREPQYPKMCTMPTVEASSRRLRQNDATMLKLAKEACASVSASRRQFCIEDVVLSGDVKVATGYKNYVSAHAV
jgi:von Willebrand factor type D domain